MSSEQDFFKKELSEKSGYGDQHTTVLQESLQERTKKLFVKTSSLDTAFLFAHNLLGNNYMVKIDYESTNIFKECCISPYDIIELNETTSVDAIVGFIDQNRSWSLITILLPSL